MPDFEKMAQSALEPFFYPQHPCHHQTEDWMFYLSGSWYHLNPAYDYNTNAYTPKNFTARPRGRHKIHISVPSDHLENAWNAIVALLIANRLRAKAGTPQTVLKQERIKSDGSRSSQLGKPITIYTDDIQVPPDTHKTWNELFEAMENRLIAAGIPAATRPPENFEVGNHGYLSFRAAYASNDPNERYRRENLANPDDFKNT